MNAGRRLFTQPFVIINNFVPSLPLAHSSTTLAAIFFEAAILILFLRLISPLALAPRRDIVSAFVL